MKSLTFSHVIGMRVRERGCFFLLPFGIRAVLKFTVETEGESEMTSPRALILKIRDQP